MLSKIFKRLRRRKSQPRVLVPPDLSLRDSFASPFPHVSEGGYTLYYELELLQQKRAEKERNITISASKTLRGRASYSQTQTPGASSSRNPRPPPSMPQQHRQNSRRHDMTKPARSHRQGVEKIPEASPGCPYRSVRKRKKIKNLRQVMEIQAAEQDRRVLLTDQMDTPGTELSQLASSSCGHGTADTPPTTVEDLTDELGAVVNFRKNIDRSDSERVDPKPSDPFDRPESVSSYYTARSQLSDS
ncbi:hypothetical protein C0989_008681 [Termitomyces sp. Mn162]|nr:hypothetical protein C0989_008681 [Termitomyces sp. Mn162]